MKAIVKDDEINILDLISAKENEMHNPYCQSRYCIDDENYKLKYLKYSLNKIQVEYFDVTKHLSCSILKESRADSLDMIFFMEGVLQICHGKNNYEVVLPNRHNLCYTAPENHETVWKLDSERLKVLIISLPKSILSPYPDYYSALKEFTKRMNSNKPARLDIECLPINNEMSDILEQLIKCSKSQISKWIYLESKIQELLSIQLEQVQKNYIRSRFSINQNNLEKLSDVKNFMEHNLDSRLSLNALAKKVGTNTFYLKKGFKELYGSSVFAYWNTLRMKKAKGLIQEGLLSIGEIAEILGFKNQHYFSTTFKKEFGFTPSQFKNQI